MSAILKGLNIRQREAVLFTDGPVLIFAGAGSGKTRVLTRKIAYLLEQKKTTSNRILAVTFTNKAAREMKERVSEILGGVNYVNIGTFHSICARLLRYERNVPGYDPDFTIYDTQDKKSAVKQALKNKNIDPAVIKPAAAAHYISDLKQKMITVSMALNAAGNTFPDSKFASIYQEYERIMRENNAYDFDDLLIKPLFMFKDNPDILEKYRYRWDYVLVDEYQDTNPAQFKFLEYISAVHKNICVVGDDDQSIYGWRGADIRNILDFEKVFANAKTIKLEQNYRSTQTILNAAASMINNNSYRAKKTIWSDGDKGSKILCKVLDSDFNEASFIANYILRSGDSLKNYAVLYRTNAQSRLIEEALRNRSIRYILVGGVKFYERKEIKDTLGYMNALVNPKDAISLKRVINTPARGIGATSIMRLETFARETSRSLWEALQYPVQAGLNSGSAAKTTAFMEMMLELKKKMDSSQPSDFVVSLLRETGLYAQYENHREPDLQEKLRNLEELVNSVKSFEIYNPGASIMDFLQDVTLQSDIDNWEDSGDAVTLMTIHSAKGLEFKNVFISGAEEGLFPLEKAMLDNREMEEERRLFYVALTRAKRFVVITSASRRMKFGAPMSARPSQFIDELPDDCLQKEKNKITPSLSSDRSFSGSQYVPRRERPRSEPAIRPIQRPKKGSVKVGQTIRHRMFGRGKVIAIIRSSQTLLKIKFESGVSKTIAEKFVEAD